MMQCARCNTTAKYVWPKRAAQQSHEVKNNTDNIMKFELFSRESDDKGFQYL